MVIGGDFCTRDFLEDKWKKHGIVNCGRLQRDGNGTFNSCADYMMKHKHRLLGFKGQAYACSRGLKMPTVTVNDRKITRGRAEKIRKSMNVDDQKVMIEKMNPGWRCTEIKIWYSDRFEGGYIHALLVKDEKNRYHQHNKTS